MDLDLAEIVENFIYDEMGADLIIEEIQACGCCSETRYTAIDYYEFEEYFLNKLKEKGYEIKELDKNDEGNS